MTCDRRRMAAVIGATLVLLAVGALLGRASAPGEPDVPQQPEARHLDGAARSDTRTTEHPLPLTGPYPRTPTGAVAAATAYAIALDGPVVLDAEQRERTIALVGASDARERLAEQFADLADLLESRLRVDRRVTSDPGFVWRAVPAGWQLQDYSPSEAVVAIWGTGVLAIEGRQVDQPAWQTLEVTLRWEDSTWRLVGFRSEDGPTPPPAGSASVGLTGRQINAFEPFVHLPGLPEEQR